MNKLFISIDKILFDKKRKINKIVNTLDPDMELCSVCGKYFRQEQLHWLSFTSGLFCITCYNMRLHQGGD